MGSEQDKREWVACAVTGLSDAITSLALALSQPGPIGTAFDARVQSAGDNIGRALGYINLIKVTK